MLMLKEINWANMAAYLVMILYLVSIFNADILQEVVQAIETMI